MRYRALAIGGMALLFFVARDRPFLAAEDRTPSIARDYGKLPLSFEPNLGQFDRKFDFGTRAFGQSILLNSTSVELNVRAAGTPNSTALEMTLRGANLTAIMRGTGSLPGDANYLADMSFVTTIISDSNWPNTITASRS
jgi:hypothetical protein